MKAAANPKNAAITPRLPGLTTKLSDVMRTSDEFIHEMVDDIKGNVVADFSAQVDGRPFGPPIAHVCVRFFTGSGSSPPSS